MAETERTARIARAAARVIPSIVERAVESGEVPSAELVDRFMREYQRELEEFLVAYCNEPALREEVRLGILRGVFQRLRETYGEAA